MEYPAPTATLAERPCLFGVSILVGIGLVEVCGVEVAFKVLFALVGDAVDAVTEVLEEAVLGEFSTSFADILPAEAYSPTLRHAFRGVCFGFGEVFEDTLVGDGHPTSGVAHT